MTCRFINGVAVELTNAPKEQFTVMNWYPILGVNTELTSVAAKEVYYIWH